MTIHENNIRFWDTWNRGYRAGLSDGKEEIEKKLNEFKTWIRQLQEISGSKTTQLLEIILDHMKVERL